MIPVHRNDLLGRIIGMLVFLIGVGLLILVFYSAFALFTAKPADALGLKIIGDVHKDPNMTVIGSSFAWLLIKLFLMFPMSIASSWIAQKGINLYFSALNGAPLGIHVKTQAPSSVE